MPQQQGADAGLYQQLQGLDAVKEEVDFDQIFGVDEVDIDAGKYRHTLLYLITNPNGAPRLLGDR